MAYRILVDAIVVGAAVVSGCVGDDSQQPRTERPSLVEARHRPPRPFHRLLDHVVGALGRAQHDGRHSDRGRLMAPHKLAIRSGIALASPPHELTLDVVDPANPVV